MEDDLDFVESLQIILERDYDLTIRNDSENIVNAVTEANPDLAILDVMFPDNPQAGFEAARALHQDEKTRNIPVIILSAVNVKSNLSFSFSNKDIDNGFMPVREFVDKPVEPKKLIETIEKILK
jgi:CheY-like chemotaxis protein